MSSETLTCPNCSKPYKRKGVFEKHKEACVKPANSIVEAIVESQPSEPIKLQNTAISLFSGCGGDTLGLEKAGFKVIAFSELKKTFRETHLKNFPDSVPIMDKENKTSDITKIEDEQFTKYNGKADILFAGFPCQGFSNAGQKKITDPRNQMYQHFVRATKMIRPLFVIGENVQGLSKMKSGPNKSDPLMIDLIKAAFEKIGYYIDYRVQEATDYGVPQKRKRVLIIGWDTTRIKNFSPTQFWLNVEAKGQKKKLDVMRRFVTNTMEGAYQIPKDFIPKDFEKYALPVDQDTMPTGKHHPYVELKTESDLLSCTKRDSGIHSEIINIDAPAKTIICTYTQGPRLLVGLRKPDGTAYARTLLPVELKQIQGFPENYVVTGSTSEQIIQIGNAVPPPMIESVADGIRMFIEEIE
jgi:DNA (cytosine-5)-methyltransferase 1